MWLSTAKAFKKQQERSKIITAMKQIVVQWEI